MGEEETSTTEVGGQRRVEGNGGRDTVREEKMRISLVHYRVPRTLIGALVTTRQRDWSAGALSLEGRYLARSVMLNYSGVIMVLLLYQEPTWAYVLSSANHYLTWKAPRALQD